jgi:DNA-binding NarL/FixJ family response regulator
MNAAVSRIAIVGHSDLIRNGLEHILARCPEFKVVTDEEYADCRSSLADAVATADHVADEAVHAAGADGLNGPNGPNGFESAEADVMPDAVPDLMPDAVPDLIPDPKPVILLGLPSVSTRPPEDFEATVCALSEVGRVLVVGEFLEPRRLSGAIRAGAFGCVSGLVDEEELLLAVRTVARGGMHISPSLAELLHAELRGPGNPPPPILAPRESETLGLLAVGLTHREIAGRMGLTEATVSTYVKRIRSKLNARNKAELTRVAIELGLLDLERPALLG